MCLTIETAVSDRGDPPLFVPMSDSFRNRLRRECPGQCPHPYFERLVPLLREAKESLYHKVRWKEPNPTEEEDHRVVQEIAEKEDEPDQERTHTDSEDDRPLEEVGLPSAGSIQLPKWKHGLTPTEKMRAATPSGELNAKQIMTVQGWTRQVEDLGKESDYWVRTRKLSAKEQRESMLDTFCGRGKFKETHLNALNEFQEWAATKISPDRREWYTDDTLWRYMNHLNQSRSAATKAKRVIDALSFFLKTAEWVGKIRGPGGILTTRVLTAKGKNLDRKKEAKEAPALTVNMVRALESIVLNERETLGLRSICGFLLFVLYTRERVSDAANVVVEPWCEGPPHVRGHIESVTTSEETKHGKSEARRRRKVILLGNAWGVSKRGAWGHAWLKVRREMGQDAKKDGTLQNRIDGNWNPIKKTKIDAEQVSTLIRRILKHYHHCIDEYTSHGLKATIPFWTGGRGVHPDVQKILGSHANGKGEMKNLYMRQSLTWPVNLVGSIIQEIKRGYKPDRKERHLQLAPEIYDQALPGGSAQYLQTLENMEMINTRDGGDPTYTNAEKIDEVTNAFLPFLPAIENIEPGATPENDKRLTTPILEKLAKDALILDESLGEEEDSEEEERAPTTTECLTNIAQKDKGNVWKDHVKDEEYLYDLEKEVVHLQKGGIAICWADTRATAFQRKKKSCIFIDDPGSSNYCPDCTGWTSKRKKARVSF